MTIVVHPREVRVNGSFRPGLDVNPIPNVTRAEALRKTRHGPVLRHRSGDQRRAMRYVATYAELRAEFLAAAMDLHPGPNEIVLSTAAAFDAINVN